MKILLCFVFFLSGVAGLVFETLWFRMAGLTFGNSVWASSLVLSSFMGGLALGNALTARHGFRIHRPVLFYARLEVVVGFAGCGLVLLFPFFPQLFAPLFRPFLESPAILNPLRLGLAFGLLLVPTTAMGATLPIMVKALNQWSPEFGKSLGQLYGWNTLGAMAGVLLAEEVLIGSFGIRGSAIVAGSLNLLAAVLALAIDRAATATADKSEVGAPPEPTPVSRRLLAAALLSGAILLALEVIWFRLLSLFIAATTRSFAIMLLVVLLGIGTGGLLSGYWLKARPRDFRLIPHLAVAAGLLTVWSYIRFESLPLTYRATVDGSGLDAFWLSFHLMFPVALVSGLLFTFLGKAAFDDLEEETRAVGKVAFYNTLGAMAGAALGGWLLLPAAGVEISLFLLALAYIAVAAVMPFEWMKTAESQRASLAFGALVLSFVVSLVLFPFGLMKNHLVPLVVSTYATPDTEIVGVREGLTETVIYTQDSWHGELFASRLVTNAISMAADDPNGKRYMKYFAYWPLAFHPRVEKALLISYGVGATAKALTDSKEIEEIDVVDISRDVLEMNRVIYPDPADSPLHDPRVTVHIEDGRFFLLTTDESYDLITGEPPPLIMAGVVNLYTQEYFELIRDRLNEGGYVTYWLPLRLMAMSDTKAVVKAFCNVFEDCSLWRGGQLELVLTGSRGRGGPVDTDRFRRQWEDPEVARELRVLGIEKPELLLATFVGDAPFLDELAGDTPPLTDNYPQRLSRAPHVELDQYYRMLQHPELARRYRASAFLKELVPEPLFEDGLAHYPYQAMIDWALDVYFRPRPIPLESLHTVLTETDLRTAALWLLGDFMEPSGAVEAVAARGEPSYDVEFLLGLRAMADRRFLDAEEHFTRAQSLQGEEAGLDDHYYRILALSYAGELDRAQELVDEYVAATAHTTESSDFLKFYAETFGLKAD